MFENNITITLSLDEQVTLSLALDEKMSFYLNQRNTAYTDTYKEFLDVRIQELLALNEKLGFGL